MGRHRLSLVVLAVFLLGGGAFSWGAVPPKIAPTLDCIKALEEAHLAQVIREGIEHAFSAEGKGIAVMDTSPWFPKKYGKFLYKDTPFPTSDFIPMIAIRTPEDTDVFREMYKLTGHRYTHSERTYPLLLFNRLLREEVDGFVGRQPFGDKVVVKLEGTGLAKPISRLTDWHDHPAYLLAVITNLMGSGTIWKDENGRKGHLPVGHSVLLTGGMAEHFFPHTKDVEHRSGRGKRLIQFNTFLIYLSQPTPDNDR